jgi:hypothetical protein
MGMIQAFIPLSDRMKKGRPGGNDDPDCVESLRGLIVPLTWCCPENDYSCSLYQFITIKFKLSSSAIENTKRQMIFI